MATISPSSSPMMPQKPAWNLDSKTEKMRFNYIPHDVKVIKAGAVEGKGLTKNHALLKAVIDELNKPNTSVKPIEKGDSMIMKIKVGKLDYLIEVSRTPAPTLPPRNRPPPPNFRPIK